MRPSATASILLASLLVSSVSRVAMAQPSGRPDQAPSTTDQLIARALEAKEIDEETAYTYYVFGAFGDSRLPAKYRGTDAGREPSPKVAEAGSRMSTFSVQTQSQLAPFFVRPNAPSSWIHLPTVSTQQASAPSNAPAPTSTPTPTPISGAVPAPPGDWRTFSGAGGKAKVWAHIRYPDDVANAEALANAMSYIWNKLVGLIRYLAPDGMSFREQLTTRPTPAHTNEYKWSFRMVP